MLHKTRLVAALLGGFLLVGAVSPSLADDKCEERVRKAEANLNKEIQRHGEHSSQAEKRRRDLDKERANCRGSESRDHNHDYDHDHDHDHDNDHPDHNNYYR